MDIQTESLQFLLLLNQYPGLGPARIRALMKNTTTHAQFARLKPEHLAANPAIGPRVAADVFNHVPDLEAVPKLLESVRQTGGWILPFWDSRFPTALNRYPGMPTHLFGLGNPDCLNQTSMAIVGTRTPTPYGIRAAESLTSDLIRHGFTIVSGFARGIDTVAHQTCIAEGGSTVAVLGSGLRQLYPRENVSLIPKLSGRGCVITEYPPETPPDARNFPDRNRIIAALSIGTLVVEAAPTGGALITAAYALDFNKEVFAVPGDIFQNRSAGTNRLIQNGQAKLTMTVDDILQELPGNSPLSGIVAQKPLPSLSLFESRIYDVLSSAPVHIDVLADQLESTTGELLIQLLTMEFQGVVKQLPGKYFIRG